MDTVVEVLMAVRAVPGAHRDGGTLFEQFAKAPTCT